MTAINQIDYHHLAKMSSATGIPFDTLCERAERGENLVERALRQPDNEWLTYEQAAKMLFTSISSLSGVLTHPTRTLEYWGIEWQTRSKTKSKGKRGCGVLFSKKDLLQIKAIKQATKLQLLTTLRVFQAMKQGRI